MKIPIETMNIIYDFKSHGDITRIASIVKKSNVYVHRVFKTKEGSESVVNAIIEFYNQVKPERLASRERDKEIDQINKENA